jgi:hypothetical protein
MQTSLVAGIFLGIIVMMGLVSLYPEILLYPLFIFAVLFLCGMVILGILLLIHAALTENSTLFLIGIIITLIGIGMTVGLFIG